MGKVTAFKSVLEARDERIELSVPDNGQTKSKYYANGSESVSPARVWPLVRFTNGRNVLCAPVTFDVVNARGKQEATGEQVPLMLAWAMSVNKSQGQTLDRVKVDLARTFERGQGRLCNQFVNTKICSLTNYSSAYVALSRAKRMETLQVLNFERSK